MATLKKREEKIRQLMLSGDKAVLNAVDKAYVRFAEEDKMFDQNKSKLFLIIYYHNDNKMAAALSLKIYVAERTVYRYRKNFITWIEFYALNINVDFKYKRQ